MHISGWGTRWLWKGCYVFLRPEDIWEETPQKSGAVLMVHEIHPRKVQIFIFLRRHFEPTQHESDNFAVPIWVVLAMSSSQRNALGFSLYMQIVRIF